MKQAIAYCTKYSIDANALLLLEMILLAQDNEELELVKNYFSTQTNLSSALINLQKSEIILKSYKLPKQGERLNLLEIPLNKNKMKDFYRSSFEMGQELYEAYPTVTYVKGEEFKLRRISKKYDSLEDAYSAYGKAIHWKPEVHKHILELIEEGKKTNYKFTTLGDFIVDQDWLNMEILATDVAKSNIKML